MSLSNHLGFEYCDLVLWVLLQQINEIKKLKQNGGVNLPHHDNI
jgi:hypothetical protein